MIGRLLNLGSGGGASAPSNSQSSAYAPVASLDSVQEDIHTRNLLFPDPDTLSHGRADQFFPFHAAPLSLPPPGSSPAFDTNDDVDLDIQDVRLLIMQDTLGHTNATLLFDSHPGPAPAPPTTTTDRTYPPDSRRTPASSRKGSLGHASRRPSIYTENTLPRHGAFDRRGSHHGRTQSFAETEPQKAAREYRDELATISSCIFGNSELMAYKGTSTKVHVVPSESRAADAASLFGDGRGSIGRSSTRSSKLSQSFTSQTFLPSAPFGSSSRAPKKKVLITRLFPVNVANDEWEANPTPASRLSDDQTAYPFPTGSDEAGPSRVPPVQRRTPMYAIVLVVQLPARSSAGLTPKLAFRESGSYPDQDVFSSSYGSARPAWWNTAAAGAYGEAAESSFSADVEDQIDSLTQHWDIIMRTLTHLQSVAATTLKGMLKQADLLLQEAASSSISHGVTLPSRASVQSDRRSADVSRPKPPKSSVRLVAISQNSLPDNPNIAAEVSIARWRIVTGLKASRVVTGQGRWGIWRDEALWTSKWSQSVEGGTFLCNLLTGFLATHTDWLQALAPSYYRRRYLGCRQHAEGEDLALPSRTVIMSEDKMAARRLVFLLSAFLPASQHLPSTRAHRPSTSASVGGFAHSPPTYVVPVLREESLRRKINRRTGNRRTSHSRNVSQSTRASAVPAQLAHLSMDRSHERRVSDAGSIKPSALAMPGNDLASRKSSAATTAAVVPETTMAHFSSLQRDAGNRDYRPDSSGSLATDDLKRSLRRGESSQVSTSSTDSRSQASRWGSVISGFWGPKRRDSSTMTSPGQLSDNPRSPIKKSPARRDRLSEMVQEASMMVQKSTAGTDATADGQPIPRDVAPQIGEQAVPRSSQSSTLIKGDAPPVDPLGTLESPVKTCINEDDGVIDVDFPFPEYITSFESAISSPSSSGYLSTPGIGGSLESFEHSARVSAADGDPPINAAGWLTHFHPDFSLQAIPPQDDLMEQIKATLRAEPTPCLGVVRGSSSEQWVEVGCVTVADVSASSVRRIALRRLVGPSTHGGAHEQLPSVTTMAGSGSNVTPTSQSTAPLHTPSTVPPYENCLGEEFVEETVYTADSLLLDAMERVMGSKPGTTKESPLSRSAPRAEDEDDEADTRQYNVDTPRAQCRTVILSALEDLIRDVVDEHEPTVNYRPQKSLLQDAVRNWISRLDAMD
ncbi:hypothetical protein GMORB2_0347 [Geosmithia morbida]|uniref:Folliculin-interacting protein N-terminal domain-containing protein n=1 Tax=Geosmithia morbida TaxID=1094350 RepID=A0A9P4Z325_9HYPO|nr:uncharacterized protein GMORB2_0347 [Geosmithia morbida]KAF4126611.1 hypothetical protein GMORB2_0347 [Geosmithia morbida]